MNCGYECYQVGGPWIAENPACPVHGAKAPQREWQGLTDEEIMSLLPGAVRLPPGWVDTVRAIEAKLKEKNT